MTRTLVTAVLLALLAANTSGQSVPAEWQRLADGASVVLTGRVQGIEARRESGAIYTYVTVNVAEVLKGAVGDSTVVVKQLGGVLPDLGLYIADQPSFTLDEDVLLFLSVRPRDGTLATTGLSRGKWQVLPDLQTGARVAVNGADRIMLDTAFAAAMSATHRPSAPFVTTPPELTTPTFTFIPGYQGRPARWHEVDDGATITVDFQNGADEQVLNGAIGGWNGVGTRLQLRRASGGFQAPTSGCTDFRDRAAIAFFWNDPCAEVPDDGVTMGYGGGYFTPGLQKTVNGVTFDRYLEAFAILNQGEPLQSRPECRTDAALHVLGHAIGLGDSDRSNAVMWRALRGSCTGLAQDDLDGLRAIYPPTASGGSPPQPPTAIANAVLLNTVTLSWTPATTGGPAQTYIVEASVTSGGPIIASLATSDASTTMVVGGVQTGQYFVRVRARNVLGTSAPSPETVVTVGPCTAPAAPTSLTYSTADNLVTLRWTPPSTGVTQGYWLFAGTAPGLSNALVTALGPTPSFSGPAAFGTYFVRIAANNSCATGPVSSPDLQVVVAPCTSPPQAPVGLSYTRSGNVVTLSWNAPTAGNLPSRYVIHAGSTAGSSNLLVQPTTNSATSFAAFAPSGTYFVRVTGRNNCGDSASSNEITVVVP